MSDALLLAPGHATCHHRTYYLTCDEYDELWLYAYGRCQVCDTDAVDTPRGGLVIDHLGEYGNMAVRGLLCDKCNALMRRVDSGEHPADARVVQYRHRAWFKRKLMAGRGFTVNRALRRWEWPTDVEKHGGSVER